MDEENGITWDNQEEEEELSSNTEEEEGIVTWDNQEEEEELSSNTEEEEGIVTWDIAQSEEMDRTRHIERVDRTRHRAEPRGISSLKYCTSCGEQISPEAEVCPYCGVRISKTKKSGFSLAAGIFAGFLILLFLGGIPIIGPIIAGLIAGIIAGGGAGRGAGAGFAAGMVGYAFLVVLILSGISFIGTGGIFETLIGIIGGFVVIALLLLGLFYGLLCMIGGAIGGLIRK
jgi:hypothetical protein